MMSDFIRFFSHVAIGLLLATPVFAQDILSAPTADLVEITELSPTPLPAIRYENASGEQTLHAETKLTILHFWATWCIPCIKELPSLDATYSQFRGKGLHVIPLGEQVLQPDKIRDFYDRLGIHSLPIAMDQSMGAARAIGLKGLPMSIFINSKGEAIARAEGPVDWNAPGTVSFLTRRLGMR